MTTTTNEVRGEISDAEHARRLVVCPSHKGMPQGGTLSEIRAAARKRFGGNVIVRVARYGAGDQIEVRTNHVDYAGRAFSKLRDTYPLV